MIASAWLHTHTPVIISVSLYCQTLTGSKHIKKKVGQLYIDGEQPSDTWQDLQTDYRHKSFYRKSFYKTEPCAFMCLWPSGIKRNFIWQAVKGQSETRA